MQSVTASALLIFLYVVCVLPCYAAAHGGGWPPCEGNALQASGFLAIPGIAQTEKHYFYWLFAPRRPPASGAEAPVVMWMTGGPGCSSGIALLLENGPCLMNESSGELHHNPYGWNDEAYLLFVDQPSGTGYSYAAMANYAHNQSEVAEDMYNFLQAFARRFTQPSVTKESEFFIIGESYGGHYVPAVAHRILQGNERGDGQFINLKGIGIGNGLTDPYTQYPAYAELAYHWCNEKLGAPCITRQAYDEMLALLPSCLDLVARCNAAPTDRDSSCVEAMAICMEYENHYMATGRNSYDIRKACTGRMCYPMGHTTRFFRNANVRASLGIPTNVSWSTCSGVVWQRFVRDFNRNYNYTIPPLLASGVHVMIYAGDLDYICNWIGNKAWVRALNWPGKEAFNAASDYEFVVGGRWSGRERRHGNFSFVQIYDAGHMVPMDQPEVSLYMLRRFLRGQSLVSPQSNA